MCNEEFIINHYTSHIAAQAAHIPHYTPLTNLKPDYYYGIQIRSYRPTR